MSKPFIASIMTAVVFGVYFSLTGLQDKVIEADGQGRVVIGTHPAKRSIMTEKDIVELILATLGLALALAIAIMTEISNRAIRIVLNEVLNQIQVFGREVEIAEDEAGAVQVHQHEPGAPETMAMENLAPVQSRQLAQLDENEVENDAAPDGGRGADDGPSGA